MIPGMGTKIYRYLAASIGAVATMALVQSCSSLSSKGDLAAAFGPVEYVNNTLRVTDNMPLTVIWSAANAALQELQITVTGSANDLKSGRLEGKDERNRSVSIQMTWESKYATKIQIEVGTVASTDNRSEAGQIHEKMRNRYAPVQAITLSPGT